MSRGPLALRPPFFQRPVNPLDDHACQIPPPLAAQLSSPPRPSSSCLFLTIINPPFTSSNPLSTTVLVLAYQNDVYRKEPREQKVPRSVLTTFFVPSESDQRLPSSGGFSLPPCLTQIQPSSPPSDLYDRTVGLLNEWAQHYEKRKGKRRKINKRATSKALLLEELQ